MEGMEVGEVCSRLFERRRVGDDMFDGVGL